MTHQRHAKELRAEGAATGVGDRDAADLASLDATVIDHRRRGSCWQGEGPGRPEDHGRRVRVESDEFLIILSCL
jgi:hypothetical protein